ncbi:hypothetical protein SAY86_000396 [Trapa natans]|uniref:CSN8/PSMD8/EIF3K domain-containing protein n=1 Tax=Trapa natans TaxID=22666 RepID=A0AAN7N1C5_TRANT|nr:hypothetical protein SAY86_000396 [Trapa natans]
MASTGLLPERKGDYSQPRAEISSKRKKMSTMNPRLTKAHLNRRRNDFDGCNSVLSHLKVMLTKFESITPLFEETSNAVHELTLARDIYEYTDILSVKMEYQDSFEQDFFQLKPYYTDVGNILLHIAWIFYTGPQLLRLLVQNRIAEFHTELELLPSTALENPYIKHAVELEQSMEGAYNRVLNARQTMPHEAYAHFMDLLAKTVRDEISGYSEKNLGLLVN